MQGVVELLLEDSLVTVKSRVAEQLEKIHKIATRCNDMVGEVENKFVVVIDTLQELNQVSMSKKGKTEEALAEASTIKSSLEEEKANIKLIQDRYEEEYKVISKNL